MIDTSNLIYSKRELFHVKIRRERNEQQFKTNRQSIFKKIFENAEYLSDMAKKIREKIDRDEYLSADELDEMVERIHKALIKKLSKENLLDILDAAVWMVKSVNSQDYDENISNTPEIMQIVDQMLYFSQGYGQFETQNFQIILSASNFLKYWILLEDPYIKEVILCNLAETIYFLINKEEPILVKKGTDILYNLINLDNGNIIEDMFSLTIFDQKLAKSICTQLLQNQTQQIQQRIWECIKDIFQFEMRLENDKTIEQFISFTSETDRQFIDFFQILIESTLDTEQKSSKFLENQLQLINYVLEFSSDNDEAKCKKYIQELKNTTAFVSQLEQNWLFHKRNKIANIAHIIFDYMSNE